VTKVKYWGVKSLAYRIKKNRKAHHALSISTLPPAAVDRDGAPDGGSAKTFSVS